MSKGKKNAYQCHDCHGVIYPNRSQRGGHVVVQEIDWRENAHRGDGAGERL